MCSQRMCSLEQVSAFNSRAVVLYSGGLDSVLAVYWAKLQGIEIFPIHFTSSFAPLDPRHENSPIQKCAKQLGIEVVFLEKGPDFTRLVRNPEHGHGKNMNPCIDCRIYTLMAAKRYMKEIGASFIITGEVVGQRPMSQLKGTLRMIEKKADCDGMVVRPLSGRILPVTKVEEAGIIVRNKMLSIAGRGRKAQLRLAKEAGITEFAAPAGGCLLTDKIFAKKVRDLFDDQEIVTDDDIQLLHLGRHIRLRRGLKVIVGRSEAENTRLEQSKTAKTYFDSEFPGPVILVMGEPTPEEERMIASILLRYTKPSARGSEILIHTTDKICRLLSVNSVADEAWLAQRTIQ